MASFKEFSILFVEVWNKGIFGINASEIIVGFIIFLFFYVIRRLFAKFIIGRLNNLVLKSKNSIDDTVVKVIEGPLKFFPVVLGFFIASSYVDLSIQVQSFVDLINRTLITIFIFWLIHQLIVPFTFLIKTFEEKLTEL